METVILVAVIAGAFVLFATEKLRADLIAILVAATLALTKTITLEQAFAGFSSPAIVTVVGVFVMSAGLLRTGGAEYLTGTLRRLGGRHPRRLIAATVGLCGLLSSFMNNIGATIILMPAVMAVAREAGMPPGRLLIPLAFGSLLGGLTTLIGTPPNLLISLALAEHGYTPFRLFDFAPTGLVVLLTGTLFLVLLGPRLLPVKQAGPPTGGETRHDKALSSELLVPPPGGDPGYARRVLSEFGLKVLAVLKEKHEGHREIAAAAPNNTGQNPPPTAETGPPNARQPATDNATVVQTTAPDGRLLVEGARDNLLRAAATQKVHIRAEVNHPPAADVNDEVHLAEATLAPRSTLSGKTLRELDFHRRYGLTVLGIRRHSESIREPIAHVRLRFGDTLLLRGPRERIRRLAPDSDFLLLEPVDNPAPDYARTTRAIGIFAGAMVLASTGVLPVALATVIGAVAMVLSGCLRIEEAHRAIDWRTVMAIGGMIPLSTALETTGAAAYMAGAVAHIGNGWGGPPLLVCALLGLMTIVITQIMTNAAAAIIIAPIGIRVAEVLHISPHPVLMIIAIAASSAFITPVGHQSNMLVYNAGGYTFKDFVRIGLPLTLLLLAVALVAVPLLWPF